MRRVSCRAEGTSRDDWLIRAGLDWIRARKRFIEDSPIVVEIRLEVRVDEPSVSDAGEFFEFHVILVWCDSDQAQYVLGFPLWTRTFVPSEMICAI